MKKCFITFVAVFVGYLGIAQVSPSIKVEYFNDILLKSDFSKSAIVNNAARTSIEDIARYKLLSDRLVGQENRQSFTFDITLNEMNFTYYVFLLRGGYSTLSFIVNEKNVVVDQVLVTVDSTYSPTIEIVSANKAKKKVSCSQGAAQIQALGGTIAFGTFFGCAPCAFVGGAVGLLGTIGAALCP